MFESPFFKEPTFQHKQSMRTAVLLCNLGTPDAPTPSAVRRYLAEFLGDHRVVEIPKWIWKIVLHGIILRVRPAKSAAKYASIWTDEGSPLKVWTHAQTEGLQQRFTQHKQDVTVRYAMRYGNPSIHSALNQLKTEGFTRILILPAYPQYSGTTTASVLDTIYHWSLKTRWVPEFRFINHYHDDSGYIQALTARVRAHWAQHGQGQHLVMSFHGIPERTLHLGDPYHCECYKTARLLSESLGLTQEQYTVTFQSRFGKAKWLEPYTEPTLVKLAQTGLGHVDVICPGFVSDCLETLEEISGEAHEAFMHAGGTNFQYIPCLNDTPEWLDAMHQLACTHLQGWPTTPEESHISQTRCERAKQEGAHR